MTAAGEAEARVGVVFEALADPTRRAVLRDAGLVEPERAGRETRFRATVAPLTEASRWLARTGDAWDDRLRRLADRAREGGGTARRG